MTNEEQLEAAKKRLAELKQLEARITSALEQHAARFVEVAGLLGAYYRALATQDLPIATINHLLGIYQAVLFYKEEPPKPEFPDSI